MSSFLRLPIDRLVTRGDTVTDYILGGCICWDWSDTDSCNEILSHRFSLEFYENDLGKWQDLLSQDVYLGLIGFYRPSLYYVFARFVPGSMSYCSPSDRVSLSIHPLFLPGESDRDLVFPVKTYNSDRIIFQPKEKMPL